MRKITPSLHRFTGANSPLRQTPFGVIDWIAVAILIFGMLYLAIPMLAPLFATASILVGSQALHQLLNLFSFVVIEAFGLLLLFSQGRMPHLSESILKSFIDSTIGMGNS